MKNKRKVLAPTIAGLATCSMVLPLALSATSCSCSKFASTSVLDGDYIPDYEPYDAGVDAEGEYNYVNMPQGEDLILKAYINDKKMPAKEHKWMASGAAYYLTYAADWVNNQLGYDAIKINKYNADLRNFKVEDPRTGRVSYDISQDIDVTLDVQPGNLPFGSNLKLDSIAGNIRLAWNHKVKNMPLGIFDFGTDGFNIFGTQKIQKRLAPYGDKPFADMTIWFVAPDMSEVPVGDKTWALDLDFLIDADIDVNGDKLIDIDHEYNFTFDKYAAWGVEQLVNALAKKDQQKAKIMGLAYVIERFIPLCSGWMSYYLSQCHHMDHILSSDSELEEQGFYLGWQTPLAKNELEPGGTVTEIVEENRVSSIFGEEKKKPAREDVDVSRRRVVAYTRLNKPANIIYELPDAQYTENDIFAVCLGLNTQNGGLSFADIIRSLLRGQFVPNGINTTTSVDYFGHILDLKFDWDTSDFGDSRPAFGSTPSSLGLGYDTLVPLVMTKDWVALGQPFSLMESGSLLDMWPSHNPTDGSLPTTQIFSYSTDVAEPRQNIYFGIDEQSYQTLGSSNPLIKIRINESGAGDALEYKYDENTGYLLPQVDGDNGYYVSTDDSGVLGYRLNIPVSVEKVEAGVSKSFTFTAEMYTVTPEGEFKLENTVTTAPFQFVQSGIKPTPDDPIIVISSPQWNQNVSNIIDLGSPDSDKEEVYVYDAILWESGEQKEYQLDSSTTVSQQFDLAKALLKPALSGNDHTYDLYIPFRSDYEGDKVNETLSLKVIDDKGVPQAIDKSIMFTTTQNLQWNPAVISDKNIDIQPGMRGREIEDLLLFGNPDLRNFDNKYEVDIIDENGKSFIKDYQYISNALITNGSFIAGMTSKTTGETAPSKAYLNLSFNFGDEFIKYVSLSGPITAFIQVTWTPTGSEKSITESIPFMFRYSEPARPL